MVSIRKNLGALALAAATILTPVASRAQTATSTPTVAGVASVNGSTVTGNVSGTFVGGSVVTGSGIGTANTVNTYGGYNSITANTGTPAVTSAGIASVTNSTVTGNVTATGVLGSTVDASGVGYANTIQNVGLVTKLSSTTSGTVTSGLGVAVVDGSTVKGDVVATGVVNSGVFDSAVGKGNDINNYGGYASVTATAGGAPLPSTIGSAYVQNGSTVTSNVSAAATVKSVAADSAVGDANKVRPVGQVNQVTFTGLNP